MNRTGLEDPVLGAETGGNLPMNRTGLEDPVLALRPAGICR
jgi:hypothetical protein